jgi:proton-translocating NADH-quinone oxidoreductase chain N
MNIPIFTWLILIPLASAPLIYLAGRAAVHRPSHTSRSLPAWLAFLALALTWIPFMITAQTFLSSGEITILVGTIPLHFDGLSLLLSSIVLVLSTMVALFSGPYLRGEDGEEKYYAMLLTMTGAMIGLGFTGDLFNLWVWFEAMAVSSYLLVTFYRDQPASLEAGVKYVVQSAAGSVLVLIGIALVLMQTGTLDLNLIQQSASSRPVLLAAGGLMLAGFGVKTALVPLHTWLPDAHTQAPSGISAMLSGVVIEAGLIAMLRALAPLAGIEGQGYPASVWGAVFLAGGALNMLVGNLMALRQKQVKRLLAYSSLSHVGYMIFGIGIAIYAGQEAGAQGGMFHLFNHGLMKGLAFLAAGALLFAIEQAAISKTALPGQAHTSLMVSDLDGAARRFPLMALAFSLAVLGLGGLPPLAGFMSKWQIFLAGFASQDIVLGLLVVFAALNSVLSLAYYAPLINALYRKKSSRAVVQADPIPIQMTVPLMLLTLGIVLLGLWPSLLQWLTVPAGEALMAAFGLH